MDNLQITYRYLTIYFSYKWIIYGQIMDEFQNKFNFDFKTNQHILKLVSCIDSFKGKWNIIEQRENIYLKSYCKIATIESVSSSTR